MANSIFENIQTVVPVTGDTITMPDGDAGNLMIVAPATDLASLTLTFPASPYTGQRVGVLYTHAIASLILSGGTFNYQPGSMPAGGYTFYRYDLSNGVWMDTGHDDTYLMALYRGKNYAVTTTSGSVVIQLTKDGLSTGAALFETIDFVNARFVSNDPNLGVSYVLSNSNKTLTLTAVKQSFTGISLLSTPVLGSVAVASVPNGTALNVYVQGKLNP